MDSPSGKDDKYTTMTDSGQFKSFILNKNSHYAKEKSKFLKQNQFKEQLRSLQYQIKKQQTITLPTERSTNLTIEAWQFNDKQLIESQEKKLQKTKQSKFKGLLFGRRVKTSVDHFLDYKEEYKKVIETGYSNIQENFQYCTASLDNQRQKLMSAEMSVQDNQFILEDLQEQLKMLKDSIQLTHGHTSRQLNDVFFRNHLRQIKEKQLILELKEYIGGLEIQYDCHIKSLKEYLKSFRQEIDEILIENEYFDG